MREVVRTLKAMLHEGRRGVREEVVLVPAVHRALNTLFRERYARTSYHVIFGRAPSTRLSTLASSSGRDWQVYVLDTGALKQKIKDVEGWEQNSYARGFVTKLNTTARRGVKL